jgi:hypothetical protein
MSKLFQKRGFDTTSNFDSSSKLCQKQGFDTTGGFDKVSKYWQTHKKASLRADHPAPQAVHPKPITGQEDLVLGFKP